MKQIVTKAIVLRRIKYQEADRILTLITPDNGKLTVLARGVRRAKSKLAGSVELFGTSNVTYLPGRGEIATLISARLIKNYGNIVTDLDRTHVGYQILKLADKNTDGSSDAGLYELLEYALEYLNNTDIALGVTKLWFELQFLQLMGHSPQMEIAKNDENGKYSFDLDKMKFIHSNNGIYDDNQIKLLKLARSNDPIKLSRIVGINDLVGKVLQLVNLLMIRNGFEAI